MTTTAPTIGGYTTSYNCIDRQYPVGECVRALLGFCDEVVVTDAGSSDGTIELLHDIARSESRLRIYEEPVDFAHPRWAIHMDGYLKAKARKYCTSDLLWQTDTDEIVPPHDYSKIRVLAQTAVSQGALDERPVLFLPMVEFWGNFQSIRADFFSWKPRFSKNDPRITHGIPKEFRELDAYGNPYPRPFESDSCNYMWCDTEESVAMGLPFAVSTFDPSSPNYEAEFSRALDALPSVLHVSWLHLERKIQHYRAFWPSFHASMYNLPDPDTAERNVMFNKRWAEVTDADIQQKAIELQSIGPRSFHNKINPHVRGKTISFSRPIPLALRAWASENETQYRSWMNR
jgi:hypothetical protein